MSIDELIFVGSDSSILIDARLTDSLRRNAAAIGARFFPPRKISAADLLRASLSKFLDEATNEHLLKNPHLVFEDEAAGEIMISGFAALAVAAAAINQKKPVSDFIFDSIVMREVD